MLRVLFIQAANNLTNPKMSGTILKEMPAALTELLFGSSDKVCSHSLNNFITFIKGIFVQWTTFNVLPSDENINKLMNP